MGRRMSERSMVRIRKASIPFLNYRKIAKFTIFSTFLCALFLNIGLMDLNEILGFGRQWAGPCLKGVWCIFVKRVYHFLIIEK